MFKVNNKDTRTTPLAVNVMLSYVEFIYRQYLTILY